MVCAVSALVLYEKVAFYSNTHKPKTQNFLWYFESFQILVYNMLHKVNTAKSFPSPLFMHLYSKAHWVETSKCA